MWACQTHLAALLLLLLLLPQVSRSATTAAATAAAFLRSCRIRALNKKTQKYKNRINRVRRGADSVTFDLSHHVSPPPHSMFAFFAFLNLFLIRKIPQTCANSESMSSWTHRKLLNSDAFSQHHDLWKNPILASRKQTKHTTLKEPCPWSK